jgi:3-methyladenine DNA glycosylase Tag
MGVFRDAAPCILIEIYRRFYQTLTMEAVNAFETPVNFYENTWRNILEDNLHIRHRKKLKSHILHVIFRWLLNHL